MSKKNLEYLINRKDNQYEVVIGLEAHAQVLSESKLFSASAEAEKSFDSDNT